MLYSTLYDELCRRVPFHPQLTRKSAPQDVARLVATQMKLVRPFLRPEISFLEIGPGDCSLSFEVCKHVQEVFAVDVSDEITKSLTQPPNFHLILSDGSSVPVRPGSIHVAYSNQLMEHLHPDDALDQLRGLCAALAPGGVYICLTPNRLNGPHDISRDFDDEATGFHLKEYTIGELSRCFREVGFRQVRVYAGAKGRYIRLPTFPVTCAEKFLDLLPTRLGKWLARTVVARLVLGIRLVGVK